LTTRISALPLSTPAGTTAALTCLLLVALCFPCPTQALDGRVDVQGNSQDGGAGATAYETSNLVENYSLGQKIHFRRNLVLQMNWLTRRQSLESRSGLGRSDSEIISQLPHASLTYRTPGLRTGLSARGIRKDTSGSGLEPWRDEHADFGAWLRRDWSWLEMEGRLQQSVSQRQAPNDERDTRESNQSASVQVSPTYHDQLRYSYSRNVQDLRTTGSEITFLGHNLQYRGDRAFAAGRGHVSLDARTSHLNQTSRFSTSGGSLSYAVPVWGGYSLDDTPEELDPLEPDPVLVTPLYDQDRDTPTIINIGDSAPPVRQYGGDYRNLILDFGEPEPLDELVLYVDTIMAFPGLMQWRLLTSDDPEGRLWDVELGPGQFSATWFELADGRQGWRFTLTETISPTRIKLVNVKLGVTEPDIRITELEPYRIVTGAAEVEQTIRRHRLQGDISYHILSQLEVGYSTNLTGRYFDESDREVTGSNHRFSSILRMGTWRLGASHEINRVRNTTGQDTDASTQRVALSGRPGRTLNARLAWSRTDDRSWTQRHKTQTVSGDAAWQIAPRLTLLQKVSYGKRDAISLGVNSEAWTVTTTVRGRPRPSLELELRRSDRWVDNQAGSGFTTFNNTELQSSWAVRPLLTLTTQVVYQVREKAETLLRNSLVWTPLPGGSVSLRLHANDLQDTRTDWYQRGGGGTIVWRPRPRLYLESGIEWVLIKQYDERNTPTNIQFRGSWSF
jgi:hypothetical protein